VSLYRRIRRYGAPAIALHWLVALGIFVLFIHGATMMQIPAHARLTALNLHRSIGVVVFALVLVRIGWRATHPPPPLAMAPLQEWIADYVHLLIYALLVANGIAGVAGWLASGDPVVFFGWQLQAEHEGRPNRARRSVAIGFATARALLATIVLHALAALKHHALDRDRLLERMWPGRTILVTLAGVMSEVRRAGTRDRGASSKPRARKRRERDRSPLVATTAFRGS